MTEEFKEAKVAFLKGMVAKKGLDLKISDDGVIIKRKSCSILTYGGSADESNIKIADPLGAVKSFEDFEPDDEHLKLINKFSKRPFKKNEVMSVPIAASNTKKDRGYEHFTRDPALYSFAKMYPGMPGLEDHDWSIKSIVGKIYKADVIGNELIVHMFIPRRLTDICEAVLDGLVNRVSVGFAVDPERYRCDSCKKPILSMDCPHIPGDMDEKGNTVTLTIEDIIDVFELSFVAVPMNADAGVKDFNEASVKSVKNLLEPEDELVTYTFGKLDGVTTVNPIQIQVSTSSEFHKMMKKSQQETLERIETLLGVTPEKIKNSDVDTISNDTKTIEDSSLMPDEELKTEEEAKPEDGEQETTSEVKPSEAPETEAKSAEESDLVKVLEAKLTELSKGIPTAIRVDSAPIETSTKAMDEVITKGVEKLEAASKALDEKLKALETSAKAIDEKLEKLEKLIDVASNASLDSLKELALAQEQDKGEKHWFLETFCNDLGGQ